MSQGPDVKLAASNKLDISVLVPRTWETRNDDYPGRLILSFDDSQGAGNFTALRVARLSLPSLLRSAKFVPRDGDSTCESWEKVALGNITAASIAVWMMSAGQDAQSQQMGGRPVPTMNYQVL